MKDEEQKEKEKEQKEKFYSVVKNCDILNFSCKWMEIENTFLSEITQTQKDEYGIYSLISGFQPLTKVIEPIICDRREPK